MNLLIFKELKQILKNESVITTVVTSKSCQEYYIVKGLRGEELIRCVHTNVGSNVYELYVMSKLLVRTVNPAKNAPETLMLMELINLIKQKDQEQTALLAMTEHEKQILKTLQNYNGKLK